MSKAEFSCLRALTELHFSIISIGKYGSFQANHILGRPFHFTFEILDKTQSTNQRTLRIVPASELYGDLCEGDATADSEAGDTLFADGKDGVEYEVINPEGEIVMRTNREIVDDPSRQKMTMEEIEALKKEGTGSGKDLISKILSSHSALDQKTAFALAKYTLRKAKKYLRRFIVLPLDVPLLTSWMLNEKEPMKIMEMREEMLALIGSWSNVHYGGISQMCSNSSRTGMIGRGRWLVVDETGGLVVAAMAERMGVLYQPSRHDDNPLAPGVDQELNAFDDSTDQRSPTKVQVPTLHSSTTSKQPPMSAQTNTVTIIHANTQPNLAILKYFGFDASSPSPSHPLYAHLKTLSWLQLFSPHDDTGYLEPDIISDEILQTYKSGKRGNYYRKRRRWERIKSVVDEARAGGYDGLVVASVMNPATVLHNAIPYLGGAAQVVVYSPNVEPLAELADYYSTARRTAFLKDPPNASYMPNDDFPLNPTLLLAPMIQTARCRTWQVLPGRTHPLMTGRGGAEGYIFTATRVLPVEGKIEARGNFKRRKIGVGSLPNSGQAGKKSAVNVPAGDDTVNIKQDTSIS